MPIFCLKNFNSSEVVENWKFLAQQIEDEPLAKEFSLVLTKMEKSKPIYPLEMVLELNKVGKYPDVVKFILEHEKPYNTVSVPEYKEFGHGFTPIHLAAWFGLTQSVERLMDKYDSPIDYIETSIGGNPIHYAAWNGHLEIVMILAKFTDVPNAPNNLGQTPIHCAAYVGHLEIVEFLTKFTDVPNAPNNFGRTPIEMAKSNGHTQVVKFLEEYEE